MNNQIVVIGSMNMDLIVKTDRYPKKGETLIGQKFYQIPGGKGANQALAAGKLGGDVTFIGACGNDNYGDILLNTLKEGGVDVDQVNRFAENTGIASITIEADGDNRIIVVPGANNCLTPEIIKKYEDIINDAAVVLLQLEIPLETVEKSVEIADRYQTPIILDPAPAQELSPEIYSKLDYLLPNKGELTSLFKDKLQEEEIIKKLLDKGVNNLVVTRGKKGISVYNENKARDYQAIEVDPVDTTAAGDAFAGALAYGIQQDWNKDRIYRFANKVAALAVTSVGAQSSLPTGEEVDEFSKQRGLN